MDGYQDVDNDMSDFSSQQQVPAYVGQRRMGPFSGGKNRASSFEYDFSIIV